MTSCPLPTPAPLWLRDANPQQPFASPPLRYADVVMQRAAFISSAFVSLSAAPNVQTRMFMVLFARLRAVCFTRFVFHVFAIYLVQHAA